MKRSLLAVIIIIAILTGMPEALRQFRMVRESGSAWLKGKMFEGIVNSADLNQRQPEQKRCEPDAGGQTESTDRHASEFLLIGKINLGAHLNVF
jgi:hypothetical protein